MCKIDIIYQRGNRQKKITLSYWVVILFFSLLLFVIGISIYGIRGVTQDIQRKNRIGSLEKRNKVMKIKLEESLVYLDSIKQCVKNLKSEVYRIGAKYNIDFSNSDPEYIVRIDSISIDSLLVLVQKEREKIESIKDMLKKNEHLLKNIPAVLPMRGKIVSGFGYRKDPFTGKIKFHKGIDIIAPVGTPVYAPASGRVINSGFTGDFGTFIEISHGRGVTTIYKHLLTLTVENGTSVKKGEKIGECGNSGRSLWPHLHYEVKIKGKSVDPMYFIPEQIDFD